MNEKTEQKERERTNLVYHASTSAFLCGGGGGYLSLELFSGFQLLKPFVFRLFEAFCFSLFSTAYVARVCFVGYNCKNRSGASGL